MEPPLSPTTNGLMQDLDVLLNCGTEMGHPDERAEDNLHRSSQGKSLQMFMRATRGKTSKRQGSASQIEPLVGGGGGHQIVRPLENANNDDEISTLIFRFAQERSSVQLESLLHKGADINARDVKGYSPLNSAAKAGRLESVKFLLSYKPDIESKTINGWSPLNSAVRAGKTDVVRFLIKEGADLTTKTNAGWSPLHAAVDLGDLNMVSLLLGHGVEVEAKSTGGISPLNYAICSGKCKLAKTLLDREPPASPESESKNGHTALHYAARHNQKEIAELLIERNANVHSLNKAGGTPLVSAAFVGHTAMVDLLLHAGANPNVTIRCGWTCLHLSAYSGHLGVVKSLVNKGANLKAVENSGKTSLHLAAAAGHYYVVESLIDAGKDIIDKEDEKQMTPLCLAIKSGRIDTVKVLLAKGAKLISVLSKQDITQCIERNVDIFRLVLIYGLERREPALQNCISCERLPFCDVIDYDCLKAVWDTTEVLQTTSVTDSLHMTRVSIVSEHIRDAWKKPGVGSIRSIPGKFVKQSTEEILECIGKLTERVHEKIGAEPFVLARTGSMREETKVGLPNEIDFQFRLQASSDLRFKHVGDSFFQCESDEASSAIFERSTALHSAFWELIHTCATEADYMEITHAPHMVTEEAKASTVLGINWKKDGIPRLGVSVDLVPAVRVDSWPDGFVQSTFLMQRHELTSNGFYLVAKPPHVNSNLGRSSKFSESTRTALYSASFSHLESEHMRRVDARLKRVYITAKALRNPDICRFMIRDEKGLLHSPEKFLRTYLLKTVFLHCVVDFQKNRFSHWEMVCLLFTRLEKYLSEGMLPSYWMPNANVLAGLHLDIKQCYEVAKVMTSFVVGHGLCYRGDCEEALQRDIVIYSRQKEEVGYYVYDCWKENIVGHFKAN